MVNRHVLKIEAEYARAVLEKKKTFEVRKNDRDFKVDDIIIFCVPDNDYLDSQMAYHTYRITYITDYAQREGYVVMSIYDLLWTK